MCYLIAKKYNEHGCIAIEAKKGKELASLVDYLGRKTYKNGTQVLMVSSKEAYGEYAPYNMLKNEKDFITAVLNM